jgi:hypothetical protein
MIRKPFMLLVLLGVAMFIGLACSNGDSSSDLNRPFGTIAGRVTDISTDAPVIGASVEIKSTPFVVTKTDSEVFTLVTATDQNGTFSRFDVPSGKVYARVKCAGYKTSKVLIWALSPGGSGDLVFKLTPGIDSPDEFNDGDDQEAWPPEGKPKEGK